jgi:hypothetical protein
MKKRPKKRPGPPPETVKIKGDWTKAMAKVLRKPRPQDKDKA